MWNHNAAGRGQVIKFIAGIEKQREYLTINCHKKYKLSFGYIIRLIWRFCAVTSRFVLFSPIWVVLGGGFEYISTNYDLNLVFSCHFLYKCTIWSKS